MMKLRSYSLVIIFILLAGNVLGAKYAGEAFTLGAGARGMALGGAVVAGPFDGTVAYWNPAGMHLIGGRNVTAMHAETFGSLLNHDFVAYVDARPRENSLIKAFGFYLYYLGGGGIKITQLNEFDRPYVVSEESHGDYLFTGSVSGSLNPKLHFGLTAKIIYRDVGTESGTGLTVDAGLLYQVNNNINAALMVSDATTGFIRYSGDSFDSGSNSESIYPTVKPGLMVKKEYRQFTGRLMASGDIRFENLKTAAQYWMGSISLDSRLGAELSYREIIFGRVGSDIGRFTAGGGVNFSNIRLDFAYLHHDELDNSYRISAGYRF